LLKACEGAFLAYIKDIASVVCIRHCPKGGKGMIKGWRRVNKSKGIKGCIWIFLSLYLFVYF
jgi:hypothetical protein